MAAACRDVEVATPARRVSPVYPHHLSDVLCPLPRRIERVLVSFASPLVLPSPNQSGRHPHRHFRGLLGFTRVTARWLAQPPMATFVTRLRPCQSARPSRLSATGPPSGRTVNSPPAATSVGTSEFPPKADEIAAAPRTGDWCQNPTSYLRPIGPCRPDRRVRISHELMRAPERSD